MFGLIANETFQTWKEQFPIMPAILLVVKQFLLIRGLISVEIEELHENAASVELHMSLGQILE
jgi:hypothetical protein